MGYSRVKTGKLLLAKPFMLDPNFKRAVIVMCEHAENDGSLGFIVNKPLNMKLEKLVSGFDDDFDAEVFYGGPVATNTLHYLHNVGDLLDESIEISRGIYWGGNFEKLKFLVESKLIKKDNIRFFVGYSGWSPGQLKEEMHKGTWYTGEGDPNYLFNNEPIRVWRQAMFNKGDVYTVIAGMPDGNIWN